MWKQRKLWTKKGEGLGRRKVQVKPEALMNLRVPIGIEKLDRVMEGYQSYQVLMAALDLGVFELLDREGPNDRNGIAEGLGINGMFSRDFLDALVDSGFLAKQGEQYFNTKTATDFLLTRSAFFQGDWIRNGAQSSYWKDLVTSLKRQQVEMDNFNAGPSPSFIDSLGQRALRGELQAVTEAISNWDGFYGSKRLLDLGGGHGLYAIALCQVHPRLEGVIFDKPHVIDTTRKYIDAYGMRERLSTQSGDIEPDSFGDSYDIVIISHLLYKFRKNLEPIFDKVCKCLNPGGLLISNHWFCAPGCISESNGVRELAKALQSFGHPLCHIEDFNKLFPAKGFRIISATEIDTPYGLSRLHLAVKQPDLRTATVQSSVCCQPLLSESPAPAEHCCGGGGSKAPDPKI
jgi:SAM-dependent methyltransferase